MEMKDIITNSSINTYEWIAFKLRVSLSYGEFIVSLNFLLIGCIYLFAVGK